MCFKEQNGQSGKQMPAGCFFLYIYIEISIFVTVPLWLFVTHRGTLTDLFFTISSYEKVENHFY